MGKIKLLANVCLLIALYYFIHFTYIGVLQPIPVLGDSWDYHIPIAHTILDGNFLHSSDFRIPQWYYPGSSEAINSLFILIHIPLTHRDIAMLVGMTRETVSIEIKKLERKGIIEYKGRSIFVKDLRKLKEGSLFSN